MHFRNVKNTVAAMLLGLGLIAGGITFAVAGPSISHGGAATHQDTNNSGTPCAGNTPASPVTYAQENNDQGDDTSGDSKDDQRDNQDGDHQGDNQDQNEQGDNQNENDQGEGQSDTHGDTQNGDHQGNDHSENNQDDDQSDNATPEAGDQGEDHNATPEAEDHGKDHEDGCDGIVAPVKAVDVTSPQNGN